MAALSEVPVVPSGCEVIQTRDHALVQRAFNGMSPEARDFLWAHLQFESRYDPGELPDRHTGTGHQLLWHELLNAAHQTAGTFFVVTEYSDGECDQIFVSADRTSAQAWARKRSAQLHSDGELPAPAPRTDADSSGSAAKKPPATAAVGTD